MRIRDFLSIADLTPEEIVHLVRYASEIKQGNASRPLEGKTVALLFEKASLRTRVSFELGIRQLGGECIYLGQEDVGLGVREPVADVARVLGRWVDAIVGRVFSHNNLVLLAQHAGVPVINALSDLEHPCQAIADLLTIHEHKGDLQGLQIAFIGDGNNVAASLAMACASAGANFIHASPPRYQVSSSVWEEAKKRASLKESRVGWVELPQHAARDADIVYTDVWTSMGQESENEERLAAFGDYQITDELMSFAKPDALFMHDLPAHEGEEIAVGMLNDCRSVVFDQAENRLYAQKALLSAIFS